MKRAGTITINGTFDDDANTSSNSTYITLQIDATSNNNADRSFLCYLITYHILR